jgi:hypothetical protein
VTPRASRTVATVAVACAALFAAACADVTERGGDASAATSTTAPPRCPTFSAGTATGRVDDPALDEISGLVTGRRSPDVLWVHNDSGGAPQVTAITPDGVTRGTFTLARAKNVDWEDIAIGAGPEDDVPYLYVGDIGDNGEKRPFVTVYRVPEPEVGTDGAVVTRTLDDVERLEFTYPDGPHDAEVLLFDPRTGDLYIVTKTVNDTTQMFRAPAPQRPGERRELEAVDVTAIGDRKRLTAGDVTADGSLIGMRSYGEAAVWPRGADEDVATALGGEPCRVPLQLEAQGEAFGFSAQGDAYFTTSEFERPDIVRYDRSR